MANTITVSQSGSSITVSAPGPQGPQGSITGQSHTILSDIGVNTHAQIDSDLATLLSAGLIVNSLSDLSSFLNGSVYELPAGSYIWNNNIEFDNTTIDLITLDGGYYFRGTSLWLISNTSVGPFITSSTTNVIFQGTDFFLSAPNGTGLGVSNGNSVILDIMPFFNCQIAMNIDNFEFLTMNEMPIIGCANGIIANNVQTITAKQPQFNAGQDSGGSYLKVTGALSERLILSNMDSRPESTENFIDIDATYGGSITLGVGAHGVDSGGNFFGSSRNQKDPSVIVSSITNVPDSKYVGDVLCNDNTTATIITTQNVWVDVDFGGNIAEGSNIERWSLDSTTTGALSYTGNEGYSSEISGSFSVLSPGAQNYELRYQVDRGAGFVDLDDVVRVPFATDSATGTFPLHIPLSAAKGDIIKPQVRNIDGVDNITITHFSGGPVNQ